MKNIHEIQISDNKNLKLKYDERCDSIIIIPHNKIIKNNKKCDKSVHYYLSSNLEEQDNTAHLNTKPMHICIFVLLNIYIIYFLYPTLNFTMLHCKHETN